MKSNKFQISAFSFVMILLLVSCGGSEEKSSGSDILSDEGLVIGRIINEESTHVLANYETAGLKKPRSIQADAVDKKTGSPVTPNATEIYVGFYKSTMGPKDVEVRFYATHADAITDGQPPADKTIAAGHEAGGAVKGAGTFAKSSYGAYIISGNVVVLCQVQIEVCDELVAGLE